MWYENCDWCYWIALPDSPVVQSSNTVSCVSLPFRTHPCVLAIISPESTENKSYNHNTTKHNKIVAISYGMYIVCVCRITVLVTLAFDVWRSRSKPLRWWSHVIARAPTFDIFCQVLNGYSRHHWTRKLLSLLLPGWVGGMQYPGLLRAIKF